MAASEKPKQRPKKRWEPSKKPTVAALVLAGIVAYRARVVIDFDAGSRRLPALPVLEPNRRLAQARIVEKYSDAPGPESLAVCQGMVYTGLGDGRVGKFDKGAITTLFRTCEDECPAECLKDRILTPWDAANLESVCGRPLGIRCLDNGGLLVADAYFGLMEWTPEKKKKKLIATNFTLLNDIALSSDQRYVYATETSTKWQRRRIFYAAMEMRASGKLWLIDRQTKSKELLLDNLYMPNGVDFLDDEDTLVIVCGTQVIAFDLATRETRTLIPVLPGTGDNVRLTRGKPDGTDLDDDFLWFGLGAKYAQPFSLLKAVDRWPNLRTFLVGILPYRAFVALIPKSGLLAVYDLRGNLVDTYQDPGGKHLGAVWFSEAHALDGWLYIGSWYNPFLLRIAQHDLRR